MIIFLPLLLLVAPNLGDNSTVGIPLVGKPRNLTASNVSATSLQLSWAMTTSYNNIRGYRVFYKHNSYEDVKTFDGQQPTFLLEGLTAYTQYKIWVVPIPKEGLERVEEGVTGEPSDKIIETTDTAEPSAPFVTNVTCYETQKIYVEWKRPKTLYKSVDYYYIYYKSSEDAVYKRHQIQAGPEDDQRFFLEKENSKLDLQKDYCLKICAGTKSTRSSIVYKGEFSEERCVFLTDVGCRALELPSPALPSFEIHAGMVVGAVVAVMFILIAVIGFLVWRRYCESAYYYLPDPPKSGTGSCPGSVGGLPDWESAPGPDGERGAVAVEDFQAHVSRLHADSDIGFSREYDDILRYSMKSVNATHEHSAHPDNKHKNRYLNIVAYDHSRVILSQIPGCKKNTDYINANYIDGFQKCKAYIASQGPLDETFEAYWRMIWEQKVFVIVMITNLVERGRRKCDLYWPKEGCATYGHIDVSLMREDVMANYTVRSLRIKHNKLKKKKWVASERMVEQFHYTSWPDHGTPADKLPVLSFVRKSIAANPGEGGPIVVHCSAGVGRTGTYITIDVMQKQAAAKGEMNVYGFLRHIRSQRNHLVQTEEQYVFLHDCLVEALLSKQTEIQLSEVPAYLLRLQGPVSELDLTLFLEKQYSLVVDFVPSDYEQVAANRPYNLDKNRSSSLVPVEAHRVSLTPKPGQEGSDYINASWVPGYHRLKEFIVTQHPTTNTRDSFWTLLWDHNAQTVLLLTDISEEFPVFWPNSKTEEYDLDYFKVRFIEENLHEGHSTLDFVVSSSYDDYELKVRIIHCNGWPHNVKPLCRVFNVVKLVQDWHLEYQNGPLVVVDAVGGTEAATFCVLTTLRKQLEREQCVDVYQAAKLTHSRRPGVWSSSEDYLYLYRVLESLSTQGESEESSGCCPTLPGCPAASGGGSTVSRRHSSTEQARAEHREGVGRRHSLPNSDSQQGQTRGSDVLRRSLGCSRESTEVSVPETVGSTAVLVSVTDDLVRVGTGQEHVHLA